MPEPHLSPGFFGKLPSHGDFISRRVPSRLLGPWEAWLDAGLQQSRETFGDAWLETYLSGPIWSFCGSAGCCGDRPFCGVLMPSVDRLGRYYPLSILAPLCAGDLPFEVAARATAWFHHMESVALSCLGESFDFSAFDTKIADASVPVAGKGNGAAMEAPVSETGPAPVIGRLLGQLLDHCEVCYSLWWTSGSRTIAACCRAYPGLPSAEQFVKLLG
jgi:type VI secretion system protein ImpM